MLIAKNPKVLLKFFETLVSNPSGTLKNYLNHCSDSLDYILLIICFLFCSSSRSARRVQPRRPSSRRTSVRTIRISISPRRLTIVVFTSMLISICNIHNKITVLEWWWVLLRVRGRRECRRREWDRPDRAGRVSKARRACTDRRWDQVDLCLTMDFPVIPTRGHHRLDTSRDTGMVHGRTGLRVRRGDRTGPADRRSRDRLGRVRGSTGRPAWYVTAW